MELAVIVLSALTCSVVMSILAFTIGRCGRKLPIDGMLPRVVHSARFSPEKDTQPPTPEPARPTWPLCQADAMISAPADGCSSELVKSPPRSASLNAETPGNRNTSETVR